MTPLHDNREHRLDRKRTRDPSLPRPKVGRPALLPDEPGVVKIVSVALRRHREGGR